MITRPSTRPQSLLRAIVPRASPSTLSQRTQRRFKHSVPLWSNEDKQQTFVRHGVPGFLSPETYHETYVKYTESLCDRLNELVLGTPDESETTYTLHNKHSHKSDKAVLYNTAAMTYFTRFFWEGLSHIPTEKQSPADRKPQMLTMRDIEAAFGSLAELREELLETAEAMFGNGFVWLMKGKAPGQMSILATYNAGSPYPEAYPRRETVDHATFNGQQLGRMASGTASANRKALGILQTGKMDAGSFGDKSRNAATLFNGALDMRPILCVNLWEHQWLRDYGLLGKKWYLAAWWDRIDWHEVEQRHNGIELDNRPSKSDEFPTFTNRRPVRALPERQSVYAQAQRS